MARAVLQGRVTPADELRELLTSAEKMVASVSGNSDNAVGLLSALDRIAELWPLLDAQGVDLRSEAGRWETLQATVQRRGAAIVEALRPLGGMQSLRRQTHPGGNEGAWWRLDEHLADTRRRVVRRNAAVISGIMLVTVTVYFALRLLFPVDPKVVEASRLLGRGDRLVQEAGDYASASEEYQQAVEWTPDNMEIWLRLGAVQEHLGDEVAAQASFARARELIGTDIEFYRLRAASYLLLAMIDEAERDLLQMFALEPENAMAWYLLGSVYEARNDLGPAVDALSKASDYAIETNQLELTALARTRMGFLMQRLGMPQGAETAPATAPAAAPATAPASAAP